jgi:hypothetical protein
MSDGFDTFQKLATIERPSCPKCNHPLRLGRVSPGTAGFQELTFECSTCRHIEAHVVAIDPFRTDAVGWLASELAAS